MLPELAVNTSLLLKLLGRVALDAAPEGAPVRGELALLVKTLSPDGAEAGVEMRWFRLYSSRPDGTRDEESGIYILGVRGGGKLMQSSAEASLSFDLEARVYQAAPARAAADLEERPEEEAPGFAIFKGRLEGSLAPGTDVSLSFQQSHLALSDGRLLSGVRGLALQFAPATPTVLSPATVLDLEGRRVSAAASIEHSLRLQPVQFAAYGQRPATGRFWDLQYKAAVNIWGKCCIRILAENLCTCANSGLRSSTNTRMLLQCLPALKAHVVPVFMVDRSLGDSGGQRDPATGVIVLSGDCKGNPALLAHEIGHVLNGKHPLASHARCTGKDKYGFWQADPCTVLNPSGSAMRPCPELNSDCNCKNADSPWLEPLGTCVTKPDELPRDGCRDDSLYERVFALLKSGLDTLLGR
ncbi:MAG TPA: hypothetical protein VHR45_18385 [Thermoanaerobaculia bacterium]|nr:hypothetical protein [Thermoanaerobaculia bacterium]